MKGRSALLVNYCFYFPFKIQGVKKAQLLCLTPGIPETYLNLAVILSLLKLDEIKFKVATDFKLLNILLGLSVRYGCVRRVTIAKKKTGNIFEVAKTYEHII